MDSDHWPREKKWRPLYAREVKIKRSSPLGFDYPSLTEEEQAAIEALNVLFVCSKNQWRSPTAEELYRKHPLLNCRSGGTSKTARRKVGRVDLRWADLIVVMEDNHFDRLDASYPEELQCKEVEVLAIEDNYHFMDPDLIAELRFALDPVFLVELSETE